ncbi:TraB/GumN family protein [Janthinobacterium sp. Mn2066]|uniref:TraB/GumN family protein n=1 Tax=Janthinobacterium sp. Mn2066 TaxID=3395264 RepID=UPI003BE7569F
MTFPLHTARTALLAVSLLLLAPAWAATSTKTSTSAARLLVAEKDGRLIFLLPESHIGTPAQQDSYFKQTIRPAFAASSALLLERPSSPRLSPEYDQCSCETESADEAEQDMEINAALRAHPDPVLERVMPIKGEIDQLGRFIRFDMLLQAWIGRGYQQPASVDAQAEARQAATVHVLPAQSAQLIMAMPRPLHSVDDTATFFQAYCALAPMQRRALIRSLLDDLALSQQQQSPPQPEPKPSLRSLYREIDSLYQASLADIRRTLDQEGHTDDAGLAAGVPHERHWTDEQLIRQRFLVLERNRVWMAQLPSVLNTERLPFYAIGADHFADHSYGPGLITLLRRAGYHVALVDGQPMLHKLLAHAPAGTGQADLSTLPALEPKRLAGKCILIPGNYSCSWANATTIYQANLAGPASPQERLTVCYQRGAQFGSLNQCVTAMVPRAPQRVADLATAEKMAPADPGR